MLDRLIGKLLLGYVDTTGAKASEKPQMSPDGFAMPAPKPPKKAAPAPAMLTTEPDDSEEESEEEVVNPWEQETSV